MAFNRICHPYLKTNGQERVSNIHLFTKASIKTLTMRNAMSYFGDPGVWPFSSDKFTEIDLGPAQQTSDVALKITENEKLSEE